MTGGFGDDDEDGLEPFAGGSGKRKRDPESYKPESVPEGEKLDRLLASFPFDDLGNSKRFIYREGERFLFVQNVGWHFWDGARWNVELGELEAVKRAQALRELMWKEFEALKEKPGAVVDLQAKLADFVRHIRFSGSEHAPHAALRAAAPHLTVFAREMDAHLFALAGPNGTIDLGPHCEFRAAKPADRLTRCLGTEYRPRAQCPKFVTFLERVQPDIEMRRYLQRLLGYCLSGSTREHKIFIFYGTGRNGKSTLMDVVREVMGDYAMTSPVSRFLASQFAGGEKASPEMARLTGARLVTAAEPPEGARIDEGKIKDLSGGEPIDARKLREDYITFRPRFKLVISTNHQPSIRGTDRGIWSRILMVPWTVEIPESEIDRDLGEKLKTELPGILNWLLDGYEEYLDVGLSPPKLAIAAVEEYRADQDPVGEFLKACCVVDERRIDPSTGEPHEATAKALRARYKEWCDAAGLEAVSGKAFGTKLIARGIKRKRSNGETFYVGVQVRLG